MSFDEGKAYWRAFVPWLRTQPLEDRLSLLQACVARYGPAPNELDIELRAVLSGPTSDQEAGRG